MPIFPYNISNVATNTDFTLIGLSYNARSYIEWISPCFQKIYNLLTCINAMYNMHTIYKQTLLFSEIPRLFD